MKWPRPEDHGGFRRPERTDLTYNFPQNRVTDHRIGLTLHKLDAVMDGALGEIIEALITTDQAEKLKRVE